MKEVEIFLKQVQQGEFGAKMQVALVNDGPVTIELDSAAPAAACVVQPGLQCDS